VPESPDIFRHLISLLTKDMEELTLTTPALLFSAVSLILLAYTNRFLAYAQVVRNLHADFQKNQNSVLLGQIKNLRRRLKLTQMMQVLGITSLLLCVACMFLIYVHFHVLAETIFAIALILLILSLAISIREIQISVKALDIHLSDME
jgi:peptidoglycan/LPS O-acetylase OafA/YrhL